MPSDYTNESSPATALQIVAIGEKLSELSKKMDGLSDLPSKLERLTLQLENLNRDHSSLGRDLEKAQADIRDLEKAKNQMDTVKAIFGACGVAVVFGMWGGWTSLSGKVETISQQTLSNKQSIDNVLLVQQDRSDVIKDIQERQRQTREEIIALQAEAKERRK